MNRYGCAGSRRAGITRSTCSRTGWGEWVLMRIGGRRGTALGQVRRAPCESYAAALEQLAAVSKQRKSRGYEVVARRPARPGLTATNIPEPTSRG